MTYDPQFNADDIDSEVPSSILGGSPLEALKAALEEEVKQEDLVMNIPNRKVIRAVFDTNIDGDKFQLWQKNSRVKGSKEEVNIVRFSCTVIGNQLKGLEVFTNNQWAAATDEAGNSYNIRNGNLKGMLFKDGAQHSGLEVIRKLYGNDGAILASAQELLGIAGYGAETSDLFGSDDPTMG